VRNDRGQVQQAATARLRQAAGKAPGAATAVAEAPVVRGAFGQRTEAPADAVAAPQNRAQRRATDKRK
jgi:preprotein translocase subunit SecA